MTSLAAPTRELASRILREVEFGQRFLACRVHERHGYLTVPLYSFGEAVDLLNGSRPYMDFPRFSDWVRGIMGDAELAQRIDALLDGGEVSRETVLGIRDLASERLDQCKTIDCTDPGFEPSN